jgi:hypothetical protein
VAAQHPPLSGSLRSIEFRNHQKLKSPKSLNFTGNGKRRNDSGRTWREVPRLSGASDNSSHLWTSDWSLNKVDVKVQVRDTLIERKSTLKQIIPEMVESVRGERRKRSSLKPYLSLLVKKKLIL